MVKSPPSIRTDPINYPHLDGPLPPGEGDLGSLRPLGAPQLVLVVDDLHDDQADAAHDARAHQYEHLRGEEVSINTYCVFMERNIIRISCFCFPRVKCWRWTCEYFTCHFL